MDPRTPIFSSVVLVLRIATKILPVSTA